MKSFIKFIGLVLFICLLAIYMYMYITLPNLREYFEVEHKQEEELIKENEKLKKLYRKNLHEESLIKNELEQLKKRLDIQTKNKDTEIYKQKLIEFDIEKSNASYNKVNMEVDAIKAYFKNLQKEHLKVGRELSSLKETNAMDRQKLGDLETNIMSLKMEYTTIQKQKQSSEVQIEQVKTQLEFVINKKYNDTDITSMKATLIDKQNEAADLHKKFIEITTKIRFETASYKDLKKKIENDDAKIAKLRIQYELAERQLVQAEMRHDKEVKEKDRLMAELKDIKEAVYIRDSSNKALQKDVNNMRVKYNDAIINNNDIHQKLNKLRTEIINESMEMKRLQDTIDKLRTTNCIN